MDKKQIISTLPHLEIVAINKLLTYENFDERRTNYLYHKITKDQLFINPILLGSINNAHKQLIVLDGVNRVEALRRLKIKYVVAQVVDYFDQKQVSLLSNHHFFLQYNSDIFEQIKNNFSSHLSITTEARARENVNQQKIVGFVRVKNKVWSLGKHVNLEQTTNVLNKLVDIYLNKFDFCRYSEIQADLLKAEMELSFYRFTPKEIVKLAKNNQILNSGITYHLPSAYSLGINLPLKYLQTNDSLANKNKVLKQHIVNLIQERKYRHYSRPIHFFNDTSYLASQLSKI